MKIIQLNIWGGKLGQQIIDFLQAEKPDFVCLQEVNDLKGRAGYKFFSTLDEIRQEAGFKESAMSASYSSRYMERELEYGNAVLSRFPVVSSQTVFTRGKYMKHFDVLQDDNNIRNLQVTISEVNGQRLYILNHHGHHIYDSKEGDAETLRQMKIIGGVIDGIQGPLILCGDFNLSPGSPSIGLLSRKLENLSVANNLTNTYTRLGTNTEVCDYIFVNDKIKVRGFRASDELVSDHKPLVLEFSL